MQAMRRYEYLSTYKLFLLNAECFGHSALCHAGTFTLSMQIGSIFPNGCRASSILTVWLGPKRVSSSLLMDNRLQFVKIIVWCIQHLHSYIGVYLSVDTYLNVQLLG